VAGLQYGLGKTEKRFFWGKRIFRFASADFRPQKGVWGMNAGGSSFLIFLARLAFKKGKSKFSFKGKIAFNL